MASFVWYVGSTATAYWLGKNILSRTVNAAIDTIMNLEADPNIKDLKTLDSIESMISSYSNLPRTHPAYKCLQEIDNIIQRIKDLINTAKLKHDIHTKGYLTRWRTYDATSDNIVIEKSIEELHLQLKLFSDLIKLPNVAMVTMGSTL
jgi:hypothetical protein